MSKVKQKIPCSLCLGTGHISNIEHLGVLGPTCPMCQGTGSGCDCGQCRIRFYCAGNPYTQAEWDQAMDEWMEMGLIPEAEEENAALLEKRCDERE